MPKGQNQKLKLLCLSRILQEQTDEEHPLSLRRLMTLLQAEGVEVKDRKSLYDDLETLRRFGLDVEMRREGHDCGYYVASREFELPEVKLLVDAVQSSRFITQKKTAELIRKIEGLVSVHQAKALQWQVYVAGRIKAMNESIYYSVDTIHAAIGANRQIRFHYFEWALGTGAERVVKRLRREGDWYQVSPWALVWDNENYYLVAYEAQSDELRHYRVDKMQGIALADLPRQGKDKAGSLDPAVYANRMFGMYHGEEETLRLRFDKSLLGVVVDRFGRELFLFPDGAEHFIVTVHAAISPQFFSWLFGFGPQAEILAPQHVREQYRVLLEQTLEKVKA